MSHQDDVSMRNFALLLVLLIIIAISLIWGVNYYLASPQEPAGAIELRVKRIGAVNVGAVPETATASAEASNLAPGEKTYKAVCTACHGTGVLNAPRFGNKEDWAPRIAQGLDILEKHALEGFKAMPAKGGQAQLSDDEVKEAIRFMVNNAEGKTGSATTTTPAPEAKPAETTPAPVASATTAPQPEAAKPAETASATKKLDLSAYDLAKGEAVYNSTCFACHGTGVMGAPKFADASAWQDRIAQGLELLFTHATNGFQGKVGIMPPKGGAVTTSDEDIKAAVAFMVSKAQ
ncbi:c-type cytochrome [Beggiatoa leptomitoformis]|uniref:Cytochrome c5 family protein n=1 Tax=Beggiatoa leptomitoformis TaxID=288004 RepID=A0A2N9YH43_9GAMM|nr:c-type cytochrome [Beggiatoa leptomitoformis]ALG69455.2 cytochrome c5 family protein [Beggiatoa leptomitoformis]AUI69536.2 cytochrome c5 family protein [Beggiatoa leptomitoformis]